VSSGGAKVQEAAGTALSRVTNAVFRVIKKYICTTPAKAPKMKPIHIGYTNSPSAPKSVIASAEIVTPKDRFIGRPPNQAGGY
jgi:hypothetical protein